MTAANPDRITPEQIAELRRLEAAATPGPWDEQCLGDAIRHLNRNVDHESYCFRSHGNDEPHGEMPGRGDGKFLAALRNAAPSLLAEIAALRESLREIAQYACGYGDPGECADALTGDFSSVDRPCAACVARAALQPIDGGSGNG